MQKINIKKILLVILTTVMLLNIATVFNACVLDFTPEKNEATEVFRMELYRTALVNMAFQAMQFDDININVLKTNNEFGSMAGVITRDAVNNIITVDFGTTGFQGNISNYTYKGKLVVKHNGKKFNEVGCEVTIDMQELTINDDGFTAGSKLVVETKTITPTSNTWKVTGKMTVNLKAGGTSTYDTDPNSITVEQTAGLSTPLEGTDDAIKINGVFNATTSGKTSYGVTITDVVKDPTCIQPNSGEYKFSSTGSYKIEYINFGAGDCDAKVTMGVSGKEVSFDMK